jgi:hypothetical protein
MMEMDADMGLIVPENKKDSQVRANINAAIDVIDDRVSRMSPDNPNNIWGLPEQRVSLVAYLKSLDERPATPWKSPGS